MRKSTCGEKIRHATRVDAIASLVHSLPPGKREALEPYPCKFCHGWHNGHPKIEPLLEFDPCCTVCGHHAMTHNSGMVALGCFECECTNSREYVYRNAVRLIQAQIALVRRREKRAYAYVRALLAMMPRAAKPWVRETFARIARNEKR